MQRDRDRVRLLHMLEHSREAIQLISGKTRQDLDADRVLSLANRVSTSTNGIALREESTNRGPIA